MRPSLMPLALCAALLPACHLSFGFHDMSHCTVSESRSGSESLEGVRRVELVVGAGFLDVSGEPSAAGLQWRGEACAESQDDLAHLRLESERDGDLLRLVMVRPDDRRAYGLDLTVSLPADVALIVRDGSGDVDVRGVASLDVEDGSGDLVVSHVSGDVRVQDGSGRIELSDIDGSVELDDGSGDVELRRVGAVVGLRDGSGDLSLGFVSGDVQIDMDGSGDLKVVDVGGSVVVVEDGSGEIVCERIGGDVRVGRDGTGDVVAYHVGGDLRVGEHGSGRVRHEDVAGAVYVRD